MTALGSRRKLLERQGWVDSGCDLPIRPARDRHLSWPQVARLVILVARVCVLDWRVNALADRGADFHDARLLHLSRRWLAAYEAIGALLPEMAEPKHVAQVRAILARPDQSTSTIDCIRRAL